MVEDESYNLALWDSAGACLYDEIRPISYPHVSRETYLCMVNKIEKGFRNCRRIVF